MKPIETQFLLNNPYFLAQGNTREIYLYVQLNATEALKAEKRIPLNLSLVIDRSGSMNGDKIAFAKKAADFVIKQLNEEDILSIVQYDNIIEVIQAAEKVKNKEILHQKVAKIQARSMTNLSGGMMEGYNQTRKLKAEEQVNRVLLLSDGLANEGVTDPEQLRLIAQKVFEKDGIGLSTFGVGADYDEKLMTNLSEHGGGNYYFIESPDKIPGIFAEELTGLLTVVAQNARLNVTFPEAYFRPGKVYGYPSKTNGNVLTVNFNDVFSKEEKAVLIRLDLLQSLPENVEFEVEFTYDDVQVTMDKVSESGRLYLHKTPDIAVYDSAVNVKVLEQIALFVSNDWFENAMEDCDIRNFSDAKIKIKTSLDLLVEIKAKMGENHSERFAEQEKIIRDYETRIGEMEKEMSQEEFRMYQKSSKMSNYSFRKKK